MVCSPSRRPTSVSRRLVLLAAVVAAGLLSACTATASSDQTRPDGSAADAESSPASRAPTFSPKSFVLPFALDPPTWIMPGPTVDASRFVTWESPTGSPSIRVVALAYLYRPGEDKPSPPPTDYVTYLLDQQAAGAQFTDRTERTVGGRPATIVTATTTRSLDGTLACVEPDQEAHHCLGLQPELLLRIAVIPTEKQVVLIWLREDATVNSGTLEDHQQRFDAMLDSVTFDPAPTQSASASAGATVLNGTWTTTITRDELANAPVDDPTEINDGNWGEFTLTLRAGGTGTETMANNAEPYQYDIAYHVDGDVLTIERDNGERFVMRWQLNDAELELTKDANLGLVPIPFILEPLEPTTK